MVIKIRPRITCEALIDEEYSTYQPGQKGVNNGITSESNETAKYCLKSDHIVSASASSRSHPIVFPFTSDSSFVVASPSPPMPLTSPRPFLRFSWYLYVVPSLHTDGHGHPGPSNDRQPSSDNVACMARGRWQQKVHGLMVRRRATPCGVSPPPATEKSSSERRLRSFFPTMSSALKSFNN